MASLLGTRNFVGVGSGGGSGTSSKTITNAKRLADLFIKSKTNAAGKVDPSVYATANEMLSPFADDLTVQQKMETYTNTANNLKEKNFQQDNSVATFTQQVDDAIFPKGDVIRNPAQLALSTSLNLDGVIKNIDTAIQHASDLTLPTDTLSTYRKKVVDMANGQRDLLNAFSQGATPQSLDGYGYFVKTNPVDGSLVSAAFLPINSAPSELTANMKRIDNVVGFGGSQAPVYLPVTKNADGLFVAKLYGNTWTGGSNDPVLMNDLSGTNNFSDKNSFNIQDPSIFPIKNNDIVPGNFGRVRSGIKDGKEQFSYYYKGMDNTVHQVDPVTLSQFQQDPILSARLSGNIPILSPDEVNALGSVQPMSSTDVTQMQTDSKNLQVNEQNLEKFTQGQKNLQDQNSLTSKIAQGVQGAVDTVGNLASGFFANRKNVPNKPNVAPQGDKTNYSAPDVINSGKGIFSGQSPAANFSGGNIGANVA